MTEYLSPGVYIEEFEIGAHPVEGITTGTDESNYGLWKFRKNIYYYGKLMTVRGFQDEQEYFSNKRSLVNRVVCGRVVTSSNGNQNQTIKISVPADVLLRVWTIDSDEVSSTLWEPRSDLLHSSGQDTHFVIEVEENVITEIRFGDNVHGRIPPSGKYNIRIFYFYEGRKCGNTISSFSYALPFIDEVTNPIPATGGVQSESIDDVRKGVPLSFFRMIPKKKIQELDLSKLQIERLQQIITDFKASIGVISQDKNKFIALFQGAYNGKTEVAEVIANEFHFGIYKMGLSQVVNISIGEFEKNLRRLFDAAEDSGAILFFDEADTLFGKRSDVKDGHDRHIKIKNSYLLQHLERYSGLVIVSSNKVIDPQYLPYFRYIVKFPLKSRKKKLHY
jgi:hypothetical protein